MQQANVHYAASAQPVNRHHTCDFCHHQPPYMCQDCNTAFQAALADAPRSIVGTVVPDDFMYV